MNEIERAIMMLESEKESNFIKQRDANYNLAIQAIKEKSRARESASVDTAPVVHAMWIKIDSEVEGVCKCSGCKFPVSYFWGKSKYCPNCGAKMDGKETGYENGIMQHT